MFWPGVNLGPTTPGHSPGEVAATREEYDRWLQGMGDLGVQVVRIYTILRPAFDDALAAYNDEHADAPIMLIHGVWIPEEVHDTERLQQAGDRRVPRRDQGRRRRRPRRRRSRGTGCPPGTTSPRCSGRRSSI
jgi:hypothetical protein